jgi:heptosyltransferase-3
LLLQGNGECVPCRLEGCDRHQASWSRCLQEMPAARVINAALSMLEPSAATLTR